MTRRTRRMTHAFLLLWIALAMIDCGKYGRPSRVGMAPPPGAAPAAAEECEDPDEEHEKTPPEEAAPDETHDAGPDAPDLPETAP